MNNIALFPGSFDPFTVGHKAIVDQGLDLFDRVIIAIGVNGQKSGLLSSENRKALIEKIYGAESRVEVCCYESLTGELCREKGAKFIIRGIRNGVDFEYERNTALINERLFPEINTILLFTPVEYMAISSSAIRELISFGKNPNDLMPEGVDINEYI